MPGIIRGINRYEIQVWLTELLIQGVVRLSTLVDDYYRYDRRYQRLIGVRKKRIYKIGQHVKVRVMEADYDRRLIHLMIIR